eukprot:8480799-Pyramimonas_sp.AAC.1
MVWMLRATVWMLRATVWMLRATVWMLRATMWMLSWARASVAAWGCGKPVSYYPLPTNRPHSNNVQMHITETADEI